MCVLAQKSGNELKINQCCLKGCERFMQPRGWPGFKSSFSVWQCIFFFFPLNCHFTCLILLNFSLSKAYNACGYW